MRFEVRAGGIAAILFAMTLLSGAVFALGLLAGYDVGRQAQIDTAQLATSYPLQPPPSSAAPSSQASQPVNPPQSDSSSSSSVARANMPAESAATVAEGSTSRSTTPHATPERQRLVSASEPRANQATPPEDSASADESAAPDSDNSEALDEPSRTASNTDVQGEHRATAKTPAAHHKGYNIQIEAAMDISGADRMMARLQKLGYTSHLVPTEIDGQRWYKVEVGPYTTAEEASDAEAEMRQKYDQTYGGIARGGSGRASADDDSDE